ncbi:MAG TPA: hypothetical protein VGI80_07855 [Pyrinomonadaceae bacterium]|jgi:hypothetical protein
MKKSVLLIVLLFALAVTGISQKADPKPQGPSAADKDAAVALAKAAFAAHGGDKFKRMKSIVMKGSVDVNVSNQVLPGAFSIAMAGDKYYFEINSVVQSIKQICDGQQTYSSIQGFMVPPPTSVGFAVLARVGDIGYVITPYGDDKKKRKGFRITTPDGFYTDFFVDDKTGQIKGYESAFEVGQRLVTTSAEIDSVETVDGVTVPKKYSQRFDLGNLTAYASFNTKDIKVNPPMDETAFVIPH